MKKYRIVQKMVRSFDQDYLYISVEKRESFVFWRCKYFQIVHAPYDQEKIDDAISKCEKFIEVDKTKVIKYL